MFFCYVSNNSFSVSYCVWLAIIYLHARWFSACGFHVSAEISSATGGILTILSFGWAVVRLKFIHHFIKNCALEDAKLLHTVCDELWMQYIEEGWSHFQVPKTSHGAVFCFTRGKKTEKRKRKTEKNSKEKHFENVQIKFNILINHLHVLLNILIMWMFTLCMILAEYFTRNNAQNMYNMIIHNRFL